MLPTENAPRLAVVLPVRDEAAVIGRVLAALAEALRAVRPAALELVLVDDASSDGSADAARAAWKTLDLGCVPARLRVLTLGARSGHQRALAAGFRAARGAGAELIFAMDADGQDDPAALPAMVGLLPGHDVVFAERAGRNEPLAWRAGYLAYRLIFRALLGTDLPFGNYCGFRAAVADDLNAGRPFRHLAAALAAGPYRIASVKVARKPRLGGKPKMSAWRLVDYGVAALTADPDAWTRLFSRVALFTAAAAVLGGAAVVGIRLLTPWAIPGWASVMTLILALIAFQAAGFLALSAFLSGLLDSLRPLPAVRETAAADEAAR